MGGSRRAKGESERARPVPDGGDRRRTAALALVLVAVTVATYAGSLKAAFVFDDLTVIVENPQLGKLWPPGPALLGVRGSPTGGRPLTALSFNVNALATRDPAGYRAVNILIHAAAGLVLFVLLRRILGGRNARDSADSTAAAFAVALLWLVHPLQTEAVTYVSQRAESLMGLCFLTALYCAVRGFQSQPPGPWFRLAAAASLLSVLAKEVGVVAPVLIVLYDALFVSGGVRAAARRHRGLYGGLALTWVAAGLLQLTAPRGHSVSLTSAALTPLGYLARQTVGILMYLKLAVWPSPLVFDYGYPPPAPGAGAAAAAGVVIAALAAASVVAARRRLLAGFAGVAFLLILAPSSSVIPVLTEVLAEHRMYLPLACVLGVAVGCATSLAQRTAHHIALPHRAAAALGWTAVALVAAALAAVTWQRNAVYASNLSLWRDTAAKVPANARAQSNLGMSLLQAGRVEEAVACFGKAVALDPGYFEANGNLAVALERLGRSEEAVPYMRKAVELGPESARAHETLVRLLGGLGRWDEAAAAALAYVRALPDDGVANSLCAATLARVGRTAEAAGYAQKARRLRGARGAP